MLKKILFGMSVLAVLSSCKEDFKDWAQPQTNAPVEQQAASLATLTVTPAYTATDVIDLGGDALKAEETLKLFTPQLPANAKATSYTVVLKDDGTNTPAAKYDDWKITADENGLIKTADLQAAITGMYNMEAVERTFTATILADIVVEGQTGSASVSSTSESFKILVKPVPAEFPQFLYVPGNAQGWSPATAGAIESPACDGKYTGYIYVDGGFKFTKARDWNHGDYGFDAFPGQTAFTASADGNLVADGDAAGVYYVEVNLQTMNLTATKITNMNLVGDFNGWNQADDTQQLTFNATEMCYEKTGATVTAKGWKFTANNAWDINLGSNDSTEPSTIINDLIGGGKNIGVVGATIKLYPFRNTSEKIYCTVE